MPRKNLLKLHEAIALALLDKPNREATFEEIALFIETRNLFPERKKGIPLATQVMLRSTKSSGNYSYLFEQINKDEVRLRNLGVEVTR
jgi:hypothetical protein